MKLQDKAVNVWNWIAENIEAYPEEYHIKEKLLAYEALEYENDINHCAACEQALINSKAKGGYSACDHCPCKDRWLNQSGTGTVELCISVGSCYRAFLTSANVNARKKYAKLVAKTMREGWK